MFNPERKLKHDYMNCYTLFTYKYGIKIESDELDSLTCLSGSCATLELLQLMMSGIEYVCSNWNDAQF